MLVGIGVKVFLGITVLEAAAVIVGICVGVAIAVTVGIFVGVSMTADDIDVSAAAEEGVMVWPVPDGETVRFQAGLTGMQEFDAASLLWAELEVDGVLVGERFELRAIAPNVSVEGYLESRTKCIDTLQLQPFQSQVYSAI